MTKSPDLTPASSRRLSSDFFAFKHQEVPSIDLNMGAGSNKSLLFFFLLIFAISIPLWPVGILFNLSLQKDTSLYVLVNLLWHISMAFIPMIAALALVGREHGWAGVRHHLRRPFDYKRIKRRIWHVPIFLLFPLLMLLEYGILKLIGTPLPGLAQLSIVFIPVLFIVFFAAGIGEELGWTGYALDPLQQRWTVLGAAFFLGLMSAVFHLVPLIIDGHTPGWIAWHLAHMIPYRILLVWIYNVSRRSMFAVVAFHSASNVGEVVWPFYNGVGYDPFITTVFLTIAAAIVVFSWGPKTLRSMNSRSLNRFPFE